MLYQNKHISVKRRGVATHTHPNFFWKIQNLPKLLFMHKKLLIRYIGIVTKKTKKKGNGIVIIKDWAQVVETNTFDSICTYI